MTDPRVACVDELAAALAALRLEHPTRVALDGVDGVGKTMLADELVAPVRRLGRDVVRASVDGFHNPRSLRYVRGADSAEGYYLDSFDYAALKSNLLEPLGRPGGGPFRTAVFDYRIDAPVDEPSRAAAADAILLFDGVFLRRPELDGCWDVAVWVDAPFEVTVARAVARDAARGGDSEATRKKYRDRYVPGQQIYMSRCRPRERADIVFHNAAVGRPRLTYQRSGARAS
jgi:uridine kinase